MANAPTVFSKQETDWHRTARYQFVPWVARLLGSGPLRGKSNPLPAGNPDGLTDEAVAAIREMVNRATWKFLARDCGWRQPYAVSFSTDGREATFGKRRLWDSPSNTKLPPLRFTSDAVDLLVSVYNHTQGNDRLEDLKPSGCREANGDLILHHLVFRRLNGGASALAIDQDFEWDAWRDNPLNALLLVFADSDAAVPGWERLIEPDVAPFFPWIAARMADDWRLRGERIWSDFQSAGRWFAGLAERLNGLIDSAEGRPDLLIFLLDEFRRQADCANDDLERFETIAESLDRRQREELSIPWSEFLKIAERLRMIHRDCVSLHPIERSGPENCFLAAWQEVTFSEVADRVKLLRQQVRPTIS